MSLLDKIFGAKKTSAQEAKDRLMLVLASERAVNVPFLDEMKKELIAVIQKYTKAEKIDIKTDSNQHFNTLEVEIILGK